jgi:hexosaminidase
VRRFAVMIACLAVLLAGCTFPASQEPPVPKPVPKLVPQPVSLTSGTGTFTLTDDSRIVVDGDGAAAVGRYLAGLFSSIDLEVVEATDAAAHDIALVVAVGEAPAGHPEEGYTITTSADGARVGADTAEGLFRGIQSLRQLFPAAIEAHDPGQWSASAVTISDYPRFGYRGASLDVARHFFAVEDVEKYLDDIALIKLNILHLHLTDDQGWRIQIESWPKLTEIGASTSVNGDGGGFCTKADNRAIVQYAAERFITIVPEIDMPGHTNAALSAYPELNCDGVAPPPYEGIDVGFSSLCASPERAEVTDRFLSDVTREVAEMTPGPWLHLGGDESLSTPKADYLDLVRRVTAAGAATGKTIIGWHEMGASEQLPPGTVGQYWDFVTPRDDAEELALSFVEQGGSVILSPADVAYLDMKYLDDPQGPLGHTLGQAWANGPTTLDEAYRWDPTAVLPLPEKAILGIEAPIWTETLKSIDDVEFMAFPRILSIAELAWSPAAALDRDSFPLRVGALGERFPVLGITFEPAPGVPWKE